MGIGIQICGLNGCGKSTLGGALAEKMGFHFIDSEDLVFGRMDAGAPYTNHRSREEVEALLSEEVKEHPDFIFAAVKGDYGDWIIPIYNYVVVMKVPREVRLQRVRNRSFQKFGNRILVGGDMYEQEASFFKMVESRQEDHVKNWLQMLQCPIIVVDGTKPVEENVECIIKQITIPV